MKGERKLMERKSKEKNSETFFCLLLVFFEFFRVFFLAYWIHFSNFFVSTNSFTFLTLFVSEIFFVIPWLLLFSSTFIFSSHFVLTFPYYLFVTLFATRKKIEQNHKFWSNPDLFDKLWWKFFPLNQPIDVRSSTF